MKKIIIIPAFNEQKNIVAVIEDIKKNTNDFDYVIINDCSTDETLKVCIENNFNVLNLPVNLGIGGAVQTGFMYAYQNGYDIAIQLDGDGQHDPRFLKDLVSKVESGEADMCIGSRFIENRGFQSSGLRRAGIKYFSFLIRFLSGIEITDATSGFRAVNIKLLKCFSNYYPHDYPEPESVVIAKRENFRITEIPVIMRERQNGVSSINVISSYYYLIKVTLALLIARFSPIKEGVVHDS